MAVYRYKAVDSDGRVTYGEIDAPSRDTAIARLQGSGYLPISADQAGSRLHLLDSLRARWRRQGRVSGREVILFTRELATLLEAGLALDTALQTLADLNTSPPVKQMINAICQRVREGAALSEALADQGAVFNRVYLNMVRAGEASGAMHSIVERMADYLERMAEIRATVVTALIYPAILLVISLLSLSVLMVFVVPGFAPLFADAGRTLPLLTRVVFALAAFCQGYWWLMLCLATLGVWAFDRWLALPERRLRFDAWLLGLPVVGGLIAEVEIARAARSLGTLLVNGVPVLTAVTLVREVIVNRAMAGVTDRVIDSLERGQGLVRPLKESNYFPPLAVQLIEVGEESGQLETMLLKIADIYDREVQSTLKRLLALLEPILILGLGIIIALIIFSILIPVINLNQLVT